MEQVAGLRINGISNVSIPFYIGEKGIGCASTSRVDAGMPVDEVEACLDILITKSGFENRFGGKHKDDYTFPVLICFGKCSNTLHELQRN